MSMDLIIMVLRGQYTAGEDMEQRLQDPDRAIYSG